MKILVLGGDGYCGWPTALHLSDGGHDVAIVDNLARRRWDEELGTGSLTPISPLGLTAWGTLSVILMGVGHSFGYRAACEPPIR